MDNRRISYPYLEKSMTNTKNRNINLVGKKFNSLTPLYLIERSHPKKGRYWKCKCECGNERDVTTQDIRSGKIKNCGCQRQCYKEGLVGKNFNCIKVLSKLENKIYLCKCVCGKEIKVNHTDIIDGNKRSCGCKTDDFRRTGHGKITGVLWSRIQGDARKRNLPFNITIEYAWSIFVKQNDKCALSGVTIHFNEMRDNKKYIKHTASLDRIDSSLGYEPGNIQWVHKTVNLMKNNLKEDIFIEFCKKIGEHYA